MQIDSSGNFIKDPQERELDALADFFKILGNPTRIQILLLLMEQDTCVGDLARRLGMTHSAVSHQLNLLKAHKLVRQRRDGKMIFYTVVDDHVCLIINERQKQRAALSASP